MAPDYTIYYSFITRYKMIIQKAFQIFTIVQGTYQQQNPGWQSGLVLVVDMQC